MTGAPLAALAAALLAFASVPAAAARDGAALPICLDASTKPARAHDGAGSGGFDAAVAEAVAGRLGRQASLRWFKTDPDPDSSTMLSADALLSAGACRLVAGYPLVASALGEPGMKYAGFPGYAGVRPDRRRAIALGTLVPSRGYRFSALTIVLGPHAPARPIASLSDLQGLRLGVEGGTLADAVLMLHGGGRFVDRITHVTPGRGGLLPRLEAGEYDAALVELQRFDTYRAAHPETKLAASGYYAPFGFNMGFVALANDRDLLDATDRAIAGMLQSDAFRALARASGITWLPPRRPNISPEPTMVDLQRD